MVVDCSAPQLDREKALRESFVEERLGYHPDSIEAMDLTNFMHNGPGQLLRCHHCGLLWRDERSPARYESDVYDPTLMKHLYPRYLRAFEEKRARYETLLPSGAEVLELGSHTGAFLEAAENWGWRPTGLDIGRSTSMFARRQGGSVKQTALEEYSPPSRRLQAIFIWNCFEQLQDPATTLTRSHQLLHRNGLLIIRVPNADFYRRLRRQLDGKESSRPLNLLGYNNLLGFPYLHGYGLTALQNIVRAHGFEPVEADASSLLTPPYPHMSRRIREEWQQTRRSGEASVGNSGPWIELVCRRQTEIPRQMGHRRNLHQSKKIHFPAAFFGATITLSPANPAGSLPRR
jgi:hypothetical protein